MQPSPAAPPACCPVTDGSAGEHSSGLPAHEVLLRADEHCGTGAARIQPGSSSGLCPPCTAAPAWGQVPKPAPAMASPSCSTPTHQGEHTGPLSIAFKSGNHPQSSREPKEVPWYTQGTIPTALSAQVNGLSLLHHSYSQEWQEGAVGGKSSPLLGKHLLFHGQHTHLHSAQPLSSTGDSLCPRQEMLHPSLCRDKPHGLGHPPNISGLHRGQGNPKPPQEPEFTDSPWHFPSLAALSSQPVIVSKNTIQG